ncbi:MAG: N-acetylglucosamine-6-phosphate deacetylase [Thermofilum sp.]|nr:N-acetylglucosamine-6-phosphate deacetylase [Thermofilum sp.]
MGCYLRVLVKNAHVLTPLEDLGVVNIVVKDGVIQGFNLEETPDKVIDAEQYCAAPGYIDTHIHGYGGVDVTEATPEELMDMASKLATHGVTAFLASTVAAPHEALIQVCRNVSQAASAWTPARGARLIGVHLEGPYLNPKMKGAMNEAYLRKPSLKEFEEYYSASKGLLRKVTVAPELEGALDFIRQVRGKGVLVSLGHSEATYEEAVEGIKAGATIANHIFNGMRVFHHREPGLALALLLDPRVHVEAIADYVHLHAATLRLIYKIAGPLRVVLITDAISAAGLPDGEYLLGGLRIRVQKGVSRLVDTGSLAGSTLTMDNAVRNMVKADAGILEALTMASYTPSKSIDALSREKIGYLRPGFRADIVILDEKLNLKKTIVDGELVYEG